MSTIKVDTVRPVTADASLTLQGDNSGTGVSGITIDSSGNATFAGTANNLGTVTAGTISGGTIGSSVVFPAGKLINYDLQIISSNVNVGTSDDTPAIASSTAVSITLPANSSAIISAIGGRLYSSASTTRYTSVSLISYTTDGTTPSSSSNLIYGSESALVSPNGTSFNAGVVEGKVDNSTGSDVTLKWNWGVVGTSSEPAQWSAATGARSHISLKTLIFKN